MQQPSPAMIDRTAEDFREFRTSFLEWFYESHPVRASRLGLDQYNDQLTRLDRRAIQQRIESLLEWDAQLRDIAFPLLEGELRYDYAMLEYAIRAELLDLEEVRRWASDPRLYTTTIARGISSLVDWLPENDPDRARSNLMALRTRLLAAPAVLEAARENLTAVPELWVELGIQETRGLIAYLEDGLPGVATEAELPTPDGLDGAREALIVALGDHVQWLENELLPRATADFRLGQYLFLRKLLYEEHVDLSVDELERLNTEAIAELRQELGEAAARIDDARTPEAILDSLMQLHPSPEALIPAAREAVSESRQWASGADLVPVPDAVGPEVREAPAFAREFFTALDAPGPFAPAGLPAYYTIANVLPGWTPEQQQEYLAYFYPGALLVATLNQTYPGHAVQQALQRQAETDVRRVFTPRTLSAGWSHYAEQLAVEQGLGTEDPVLRLAQVQRALERHARWDAVLQLHARRTPLDQVVQRFEEISYLPPFAARQEVVRATYDPLYLNEALGRMQILELREDYQAFLEERDEEFSLRQFHERLLELALPLPLAREVLMPTRRERPPQIYR